MNKKVLSDHKKRGQRFIPPALDILSLHETSYTNQLLPEIIWLALLKVQIGSSRTIDIALEFIRLVNECLEEGDFRNFTLVGRFEELDLETKSSIANRLVSTSIGGELLTLLSPLLENYPNCPLNFLYERKGEDDKEKSLLLLNHSVEQHMDRYSHEACVLQAMVPYLRQEMGGLHYPEHMEKPDFESFIRSDEEEGWEKLAGRIRIAANLELMPAGNPISDNWAKYFWNRGIHISNCV